jgi:phenylacetate-CoA ligase
MKISESIERYKRKYILYSLLNTSPNKFERISKGRLIAALNRFYKISPAYRDLLKKMGIDLKSIQSITDFRTKLPVLNKQNFFNSYTFRELLGKNFNKVKLATSSSGFSGTFAFGFASANALTSSRIGVDATLEYWFDISNRKTFLINCAPMGVHVETSLPMAETSVRSDMALSLIKKISPEFDHTIIVGDPHFLKKLLEEGTGQKIPWKARSISLVTGQDWLPESLRTYLANMLEIDLETDKYRGIYATMGMTELGLNVFHESKFTVRLRRVLLQNTKLRQELTKTEMKACPIFFHYYPFSTYIESIETQNRSELLFSVLDTKNLLPLIRYSTGDAGEIVSYNDLIKVLGKNFPQLIPDLKLPLGIMQGRLKNEFISKESKLYMEDIKEGIYSDFDVAASITGLLSLKINSDDCELWVQLKSNIQKVESLGKKIKEAVHSYLSFEIKVHIFEYKEFPKGLEINYERKLSAF